MATPSDKRQRSRYRVIFVTIGMGLVTGCIQPPQMQMGMAPGPLDAQGMGAMPMQAGMTPTGPAAPSAATPLTTPVPAQFQPTGGVTPTAASPTGTLPAATPTAATPAAPTAATATPAAPTATTPASPTSQATQIQQQIVGLDAQVGALLRQGVPPTDPRITAIQQQAAPLVAQYQQLTGQRI